MRFIIVMFSVSLLIFGLLGFGSAYMFPPYQTLANTFFEAIATQDYDTAYGSMSSIFHAKKNRTEFEAFFEASEYTGYKSGEWFALETLKTTGRMQGRIQLKSGKLFSVQLYFVREKDPAALKMIKESGFGMQWIVKDSPGRWKIDDMEIRPFGEDIAQQPQV